ncbi:MAG: hypothetical protein TEF_00745 [Rhizobiales bacterium NRL2]|jgi:hypothetical protein|nr:MAG: hypothetical protein TEF_00745 [Rhizobiales bacterium NRL2]
MRISSLAVDRCQPDGDYRVFATAHDINWLASALLVLDRTGKVLGEFWNPGWLMQIAMTANCAEIAVWGYHNDLRLSELADGSEEYFQIVAHFSADHIAGFAPSLPGERSNGSFRWYKALTPQGTKIREIEFVGADVNIWLRCGKSLALTSDGAPGVTGIADFSRCRDVEHGFVDIASD